MEMYILTSSLNNLIVILGPNMETVSFINRNNTGHHNTLLCSTPFVAVQLDNNYVSNFTT